MKKLKCGECDATDVRLYRPYGSFYRPEDNRCNIHLTLEQRGWYVPLCVDEEDDAVWGYTSDCDEAAKAREKFYSLPEHGFYDWTWARNGFKEGWYLSLMRYKDEKG